MSTIHEHVDIDTPAEKVWDAARDLGALHTRLVPGFVTDTNLEGEERVVTFGDGRTLREPIISCDDARRRLAWTAVGGIAKHYNAVLEVHATDAGCRVTWTVDVLPHALATPITSLVRAGLAAMKKNFA